MESKVQRGKGTRPRSYNKQMVELTFDSRACAPNHYPTQPLTRNLPKFLGQEVAVRIQTNQGSVRPQNICSLFFFLFSEVYLFNFKV